MKLDARWEGNLVTFGPEALRRSTLLTAPIRGDFSFAFFRLRVITDAAVM